MTKYTTIQQHEPIRIPSGWNEQERRLIAQLEEIFDDLYRRFNRIRIEDLSPALGKTITTTKDDVRVLESKVTHTAEKLESLVLEKGNFKVYVQSEEPTEQAVTGDVWVRLSTALTWHDSRNMTWADLAGRTWADLLGQGEPVSHFWDGSGWVVMADPNLVLNSSVRVTETAKMLESVATQTRVNSQGVETLETQFRQTAEALELKANKGDVKTQFEQTAEALALKANKGDPATALETTTVTVAASGVRIKTGGTFQVESGNFELDESGELSAYNAYLSGDMFIKGFPALSGNDIVVGTTPPDNAHAGMVWIRPDASLSAQTTFSKIITWGDRQEMVSRARTGTLTGSAAEAVGSSYTYLIKIPVYIREYSGGKTGAVLHFDLYDAEGGSLLLEASRNVTINEYGSGNKVIEIPMAGGDWIGNRSSMFFRLYTTQLNGYYAYNVLNSSDGSASIASITVNCTSVSSGGATGWRECQVYSFV